MNPYKHGMDVLLAGGLGKPTEDRVLLKTIFNESDLTNGVGTVTKQIACHEVVAIGPDVVGLEVGDHVIHVSAAADAADSLNPNAQFCFVRAKYVQHHWKPAEAAALFEALKL